LASIPIEQRKLIANPDLTPSAQILAKMRAEKKPFAHFAEGVSRQHAQNFSAQKLNVTDTEKFIQMVLESHTKQQEIETHDTLSFDDFLSKYFSQK
jgi:glutamate--cysteine ligase